MIRKWTASLLAIVLCAALLSAPALAYERVDSAAQTSLALNFYDESGDRPISGMALRIYQVCTMSDSVRFAFTEDFKDAGVAITGDMDAVKWAALAGTLAAYVNTHHDILPADTGTTDADGVLTFSDLPVGLYLVTGSSVTLGSYRYSPASFLLTLPSLNVEEDAWDYEVIAENKFTRIWLGDGGPSTVSRNVTKVWAEDEGEARPSSVEVSLLRDGSVYDTVTLSTANTWKHSWTGLDAGADWTLTETKVPEDYTMLVEQTGNTFVVTNTYTVDIDQPEVPLDPEPPEVPDGPGTDIPDGEVPGEGLPQTGIFWWPIQLLTLAGIMFFSAGWLGLRHRKRNGHNEP